MNTRNQPDSSNKLAILPMWVIDRIKEEMRPRRTKLADLVVPSMPDGATN